MKSIPVFLLLAGLTGAFTPVLAQTARTQAPAQAQADHKATTGTQEFGQQNHERRLRDVARLLNLTPEQETKARQIFDRATRESSRLFPEMRQDREQIRSLFANANNAHFDAEIDRLANREGQIYAETTKIHTKAMKEFYSMLTPEQQKKSADLYDLLITQPSMGVRMGRMLGEMGNGPTE